MRHPVFLRSLVFKAWHNYGKAPKSKFHVNNSTLQAGPIAPLTGEGLTKLDDVIHPPAISSCGTICTSYSCKPTCTTLPYSNLYRPPRLL